MRFMMMMIPNIPAETWQDGPDPETVGEMTKFNQQLTDAGALLAADGFQPPSEGARVTRSGGETTVGEVPDRPGETIGGYWIIDVATRDEAVDWARRCPLGEGESIELRRIYEASDHPAEVQEAAKLSQTPPEQTAAR